MRERRRILLAVVLVLMAVVAFYFWVHSERERQLAVQEAGSQSLDVESTVIEGQSTGDVDVTLYLYKPGAVSPGAGFLEGRSATIYQTDDEILRARQIVNELLKDFEKQKTGPEGGATSYPDRTRLRNLYILQDGTAVVDLAAGTVSLIGGGITSELAVIRSVTRSLVANVDSIKQVRFLVDGKAEETLAGHISITQPFR